MASPTYVRRKLPHAMCEQTKGQQAREKRERAEPPASHNRGSFRANRRYGTTGSGLLRLHARV